MNLNDFRASAYKNQSQNDDNVKESKQHVVKAFEPIKLTKDFNSSENSKIDKKNLTETRNEVVNKNKVKEFSPKDDIVHSKENNSQYDSTEILKNSGLLKVPVAEKEKDGKESIYRRVAKFLVLIGEDEAAKILPHLSEVQIEKIIPEIASIRTVSKDESSVILAEFKSLLDDSRKSGGIETARDILQKAYGKKRADEMLEKSVPFEGKIPFNYLNDADNERIYQLLKDENEGIKAIVLS